MNPSPPESPSYESSESLHHHRSVRRRLMHTPAAPHARVLASMLLYRPSPVQAQPCASRESNTSLPVHPVSPTPPLPRRGYRGGRGALRGAALLCILRILCIRVPCDSCVSCVSVYPVTTVNPVFRYPVTRANLTPPLGHTGGRGHLPAAALLSTQCTPSSIQPLPPFNPCRERHGALPGAALLLILSLM